MNHTRLVILLVVAALMASACAALAQGEPVTLAYKFRAGEIVYYDMTIDGDGAMEMVGMPNAPGTIPIEMTINMLLRHKVAGVAPDGTATCTMQIKKMTLEQKVMGQNMEMVISEKETKMTLNGQPMPGGGGAMPDFKEMPMFGKPLIVKMRPTGEVVEVEGLDSGKLGEMLKGMGFDWSQFSQMFMTGSAAFPADPVAVGETWEQRVKLPFPTADPNKPVEMVTTYKLEKLGEIKGDPTARISYSSFQDLSGLSFPGANPAMPGMTIDRMSIDTNGVMLWSLERGLSPRTDFQMTMDMGMSMPAGDQNVQMSMRMNMRGLMVLKK